MRTFALLAIFIPLLTLAQPKYSSESKKLYSKAVKEFKGGDTEKALSLFQECVAAEPRYAEAYLNISLIQYSKKQMGDALVNAKNAYGNNNGDVNIISQLGKCYYQGVKYDSAAFFLNKSIEMGKSDEFLYLYAGKSNYEVGDNDKAEDCFNKAIALNGNNPVSYNSRGKVFFSKGEYDKAETDFKKAIELNPEEAGPYANLANTYLDNERIEDALEYIEIGMERADESQKIQMLLLLGEFYHKSGEFEQAVETFNQAYEMDQKNAFVLNNQAAVLLDQDKFEDAVAKLNLALELEPEMMEAYFNRGIANEMLRNVEDACSDWEQAFILGSEKAEEYLNSPTCNE